MNEIGVRIPDYNFVTLENVKMATEKAPTKADFLAALNKKGIKSLEDLIDAVMPEPDETGGYVFGVTGMAEEGNWPDTAGSLENRGHGPDVWKGRMVAGFFSLYGE